MSRSVFLVTLIALTNLPLFAQVAVGQWRDHLPYTSGVRVAVAGDWVYSASKSGLFKYHKTEGDIVRISKVTGLSDIGFTSIAWSDEYQTLVVVYTNTNIDLIKDGQIINVPDIRNKSILGNKTINDIHIKGDLAYLACGFAIVVMDIAKREIRDTYYIGPDGGALDIHDVTTSDSELFAATEIGVFHAPLVGSNLADFQSWEMFNALPGGVYNAATWFDDKLFVNLSVNDAFDSIYFYKNSEWNYFNSIVEHDVRSLESTDERLLISVGQSVSEYNKDLWRVRWLYGYEGGSSPNHATTDNDGTMWIADRSNGLVRHTPDQGFSFVSVNGPSSVSNTAISVWDGRCYVAAGELSPFWGNTGNKTGLYGFKNDQWNNLSVYSFPETSSLADYIRVLVDPFDSRRVYAASWNGGLVEYYDDQFAQLYNPSNSALENNQVSGMAIDRNTGTLWIAGASTFSLLYAKEQNGTWHGFNVPGIGNIILTDIAIDNIGQKWIVAPRGAGLVVYNHGETLGNTSDDRSLLLSQNAGNGELPSKTVLCVAADLDGEIWVGTDVGLSVFYSPESVFTGDNFDSQQILVEQDGYVQYLLENEAVSTIQVDGANRKWIGTRNAGVFLMSEDGTEQIQHFTKDNSPLFSDQITSLGIDHLSGEVFIGTDKGIISYKGTATWGTSEFASDDVYAYPNPVEPDYEGPIAIKGLVRDADVKITDAAGNVVYATVAEGGQAIWNGNRLTGGRAKTGVYLVFASNDDGKETFVTKILFIN